MENKQKIKLSIFLEAIILICFLGFSLIIFVNLNEEEVEVLPLESVKTSINSKIEEICDEYYIDIIYGSDTFDLAESVNAIPIMDEERIMLQLEAIETALNKYDDDFFIKDKLTIVLLDYFSNNNLALASRNNLGQYKIYLSYNDNLERSIHHEIYHVFEYMNGVSDEEEYINWSYLNPDEFIYESEIAFLTTEYVFGSSLVDDNIYFVTKYSKTSAKEDRAEIFAEIMMSTYDFSKNENIIEKIEAIEKVINMFGDNINIDINKYD